MFRFELESKLNSSNRLVQEQQRRSEAFQRMTDKYTHDLHEHEDNISKLELRASRNSSRGRTSDEEEEEEEEEE